MHGTKTSGQIGRMRLKILIVAPEQIPVPGTGSVEICILAIAKKLAEHHQAIKKARPNTKVTLFPRQFIFKEDPARIFAQDMTLILLK